MANPAQPSSNVRLHVSNHRFLNANNQEVECPRKTNDGGGLSPHDCWKAKAAQITDIFFNTVVTKNQDVADELETEGIDLTTKVTWNVQIIGEGANQHATISAKQNGNTATLRCTNTLEQEVFKLIGQINTLYLTEESTRTPGSDDGTARHNSRSTHCDQRRAPTPLNRPASDFEEDDEEAGSSTSARILQSPMSSPASSPAPTPVRPYPNTLPPTTSASSTPQGMGDRSHQTAPQNNTTNHDHSTHTVNHHHHHHHTPRRASSPSPTTSASSASSHNDQQIDQSTDHPRSSPTSGAQSHVVPTRSANASPASHPTSASSNDSDMKRNNSTNLPPPSPQNNSIPVASPIRPLPNTPPQTTSASSSSSRDDQQFIDPNSDNSRDSLASGAQSHVDPTGSANASPASHPTLASSNDRDMKRNNSTNLPPPSPQNNSMNPSATLPDAPIPSISVSTLDGQNGTMRNPIQALTATTSSSPLTTLSRAKSLALSTTTSSTSSSPNSKKPNLFAFPVDQQLLKKNDELKSRQRSIFDDANDANDAPKTNATEPSNDANDAPKTDATESSNEKTSPPQSGRTPNSPFDDLATSGLTIIKAEQARAQAVREQREQAMEDDLKLAITKIASEHNIKEHPFRPDFWQTNHPKAYKEYETELLKLQGRRVAAAKERFSQPQQH